MKQRSVLLCGPMGSERSFFLYNYVNDCINVTEPVNHLSYATHRTVEILTENWYIPVICIHGVRMMSAGFAMMTTCTRYRQRIILHAVLNRPAYSSIHTTTCLSTLWSIVCWCICIAVPWPMQGPLGHQSRFSSSSDISTSFGDCECGRCNFLTSVIFSFGIDVTLASAVANYK